MQTLLSQLRHTIKKSGGSHVVASDMLSPKITYRQLITRASILSGKLAPLLDGPAYVGVLLPNALGVMVTFVGLHMIGRVPCMLNFSAGESSILHACNVASIKHILTSRRFIEKGGLESLAEVLEKHYNVIYLEDIRETISLVDKIKGALCGLLGRVKDTAQADDPAVVLYTSGSEGKPKGVALSHHNILSNIDQACVRLNITSGDSVFNALPVFHSFGLTVGMLLPMLRGLHTYLYPSPLHYKIIPKLIGEVGSNIMVGTDTFYTGYAKYGKKEHFTKVRLAVAGAEKLKPQTRAHWLNEYGVRILEGYGVTETSPVLSVNTAEDEKPGTVGRLLDGIEARLEPIEGIHRGGRLFVKGPNVMLGYLKEDKPGIIQPQGEWYDTGDIIHIDTDGYLSIQGRAKRFAKIGGEMISLLAVEEFASHCAPDHAHAVVSIPDDKKGEQLVLYTEDSTLTRELLIKNAKNEGVAEISLPKKIVHLEQMARLGNGKIDYPGLTQMALSACGTN